MRQLIGQTADGFVHFGDLTVKLGIEPPSSRPFRIAPGRRVDGQAAETGKTDFAFNSRADDERPDAQRQLAQFHIRSIGRNSIVGSSSDPYAAADAFSLDTNDNEFGAFTHGIDQMRETAEELETL